MPLRRLAAQYGPSPSSLARHHRHLRQQLALRQRQSAHQALQDQLELLSVRLDRLFHAALDHHSLYVALGALLESLRLHLQKTLHERYRLPPPPGP